MPHSRTLIRQAVYNSISGITQFDGIYNSYVGPFPNSDSVNILTLDESVAYEHSCMNDTSEQERELRILIEIRTPVYNELLDNLDSFTEYVENAIYKDTTLNNYAYNINLESLTFEYSRDSDGQLGKATMTYSLLYQCDGSNPSTIL